MKRRHLIKAGGASALALGAAGVAHAEEKKQYNWKMVMSWPKGFPGLGTGAQWFADELRRVTDGQINLTIYGGGELVPALEVFNAVSDGTAEIGHGASYYWKGTVPEAELFCSVPFGMIPIEHTAWYNNGGGRELQAELYKPFGVIPMLGGNSDSQMGGWFNKEINSIDDFKGLKIRIPGIGGEVLQRAGATTVTMPGSEIFTSMQNGVIDAADWVGPWNDLAFGLHKTAKYYYGGWHEPSAGIDLLINEKAWNELTPELQAQVEAVAQAMNQNMISEFRINNGKSLDTLVNENGVEVRYFDKETLKHLQDITDEYLEEYAQQSDIAKRIKESYQTFLKQQIAVSKNNQQILDARAE
ncbi:TRAP transporter substrate-binding protein [Cardiobacteriaceae bacterium TAE3-ERU3]|nr:TRAP transporter substrate-binding protein [Cardiobacteriaceae bacterium TAE3-ERU3]